MNDIRIVGNESVPLEELRPIVGELINRDYNPDEVEQVTEKIKEHYRSKGLVSAYVFVPEQKIENGVIEIRIVEGKFGSIEITGNNHFSDGVILRRVKLDKQKTVDYQGLRKSLNRLNRHRDIAAKAVLKPGPKPGTTAVALHIKDKLPVHIGADVNNLGTRNTGRARFGQSVTLTNATGNMDELSGRFQIGKRALATGARYEIPVNAADTRVGVAFTHARVDVGGDFKELDLKGHATTYSAYVLQPFLDTKRFEAALKTGFDWKSVKNRVLDQLSGRDELRIWNLGLNFNESDKYGKTFTDQSFHFGFSDFLGASHKTDKRTIRTGSGGQFFVYRAEVQRFFVLPAAMMLGLKFASQLTEDKLAPSEQFRMGGAYSLRGYEEGEYLADYGARLSTEILVPTYFFPKDWKLPWAKEPLREQIKGVAFFDFGGAGLHGALPGERANRFLAGTGGGVRMQLYHQIFARVEWATSIGSSPSNGSENIFYFGVSAEAF